MAGRGGTERQASSKIVEPLAEAAYEGDGLGPLLATAWEGSQDGKSVTFSLREGVNWHDGEAFHLGRRGLLGDGGLEAAAEHRSRGLRQPRGGRNADARTAVFRFSKPTPMQLIANALPVVSSVLPKHLFEGTDIAENPVNAALVGTGPFLWGEYRGRIAPRTS